MRSFPATRAILLGCLVLESSITHDLASALSSVFMPGASFVFYNGRKKRTMLPVALYFPYRRNGLGFDSLYNNESTSLYEGNIY